MWTYVAQIQTSLKCHSARRCFHEKLVSSKYRRFKLTGNCHPTGCLAEWNFRKQCINIHTTFIQRFWSLRGVNVRQKSLYSPILSGESWKACHMIYRTISRCHDYSWSQVKFNDQSVCLTSNCVTYFNFNFKVLQLEHLDIGHTNWSHATQLPRKKGSWLNKYSNRSHWKVRWVEATKFSAIHYYHHHYFKI